MATHAETQGTYGGRADRTDSGDGGLKPVIEQFFQEILRPHVTPQVPDPTPRQETPRQEDDVQRPRDPVVIRPEPVPVNDREGPVIRPAQRQLTGSQGGVVITARITDASRIAWARAQVNGQAVTLRPTGNGNYEGRIPLRPDYEPARVRIDARDIHRNRANPAEIYVRRVPACGNPASVSTGHVRSVQTSLGTLAGYSGGVDGLAGPVTCSAISDFGVRGVFDWPSLAQRLERLLDTRQIAIQADVPRQTTSAMVAIRVQVQDPRQSGAVAAVSMVIDGKTVEDQPYRGTDLGFLLPIAEGATHKVTFLARPKDPSAKPLAWVDKIVSRPAPLVLSLSARGLVAGRITSDAETVPVTVDVTGADTARVFYEIPGVAPPRYADFTGQAIDLDIPMPDPDAQYVVRFGAAAGQRNAAPQRIIVTRELLPGLPVYILEEVTRPPGEDAPPDQTGAPVVLPAGFQTPALGDAPSRDGTPQIDLSVPAPRPALPPWLAPVALGAILILGMIAGMVSLFRKGFRRHPPKMPVAALSVRVVAVPDTRPKVELVGADLPGLLLRVEPGLPRAAMVEFDEEEKVLVS